MVDVNILLSSLVIICMAKARKTWPQNEACSICHYCLFINFFFGRGNEAPFYGDCFIANDAVVRDHMKTLYDKMGSQVQFLNYGKLVICCSAWSKCIIKIIYSYILCYLGLPRQSNVWGVVLAGGSIKINFKLPKSR